MAKSNVLLAKALGYVAKGPPLKNVVPEALRLRFQREAQRDRQVAQKAKRQEELDEKYAVNIDPKKYFGPALQEEARVASQEHLDKMNTYRKADPYNWSNSTKFRKDNFNFKNKMKALEMESDMLGTDVKFWTRQDLDKAEINQDLDKAIQSGSPERYRAALKKMGATSYITGMYGKHRPIEYMEEFREATNLKHFTGHIAEIDVEEGKHIRTKSGTYFNKEYAREYAREMANGRIGVAAAADLGEKFPDATPKEIAQMVEDKLYNEIENSIPHLLKSGDKIRGGGEGMSLNFGGASQVGQFMLVREEESPEAPDISLKMWDRYQEDMESQGIPIKDRQTKDEFLKRTGIDTLKNKVVVRIADLKGKIPPLQSFTTEDGRTIKGNAVALTKGKGIGGKHQINVMEIEETAGAGIPTTYKLTTVPLSGKNSASNKGWLQGLHPEFNVDEYLKKTFNDKEEEEETTEVKEFTREQWKQAGWSDAQIDSASKAGKIKVK